MKIIAISYNFFTKQMLGLAKDADIIGDALKECFTTPLKVTNIGDDKPAELPRIIGDPKYGFRLLISQQSWQIIFDAVPASFSDEAVLETLGKTVHTVGTFLENYLDASYNFTGVTMKIKITEAELGSNPLMFLIKKMPITDTKSVIENLTYRAAYIESPYYINYAMHNEKQMQVQAANRFAKPTGITTGAENLIIDFDVNDKYAFLHERNYFPNVEEADTLIESVTDFYTNHMFEFVKTGQTNHFFIK